MEQLLFEVAPITKKGKELEPGLSLAEAEKEYKRLSPLKEFQPVTLVKCNATGGYKVWTVCSLKSLEKYGLSFSVIRSTEKMG